MTQPTPRAPVVPGRIPAARPGAILRIVLVALAAATAAAPAAAQAPAPEAGFSELVKAKLPAVVTVTSTREVEPDQRAPTPQIPPGSPFEHFFDQFPFMSPDRMPHNRPARALGSGFVIDLEGYIVTNNHVIQGADEIEVILHDGRELPAEIVGTDPATDLAVLKVETEEPLPAMEWGDSEAAEVGDWVVAIGNPFGLGGTVTAGIISARARDINSGPYDDFFQTDAAINQGNSGGPMLNLEGEVIGVNTAIFSQTGGSIGIGFAIPSELAQPIVAEIRENGQVRRGWLGVSIQPVTDEIAEAMGLDDTAGALVSSVVEGSPAEAAGLQVGDIIVGFGGEEIGDPQELQLAVADSRVESAAEVTVLRGGERETLSVDIGLLDPERLAMNVPGGSDAGALGLSLAPLTAETREQFGIEDEVTGAVIAEVETGSPADEAGFEAGDVITRIGQDPVESPEDVTAAVREAREADRPSVLVLTERNGRAIFMPLPLG